MSLEATAIILFWVSLGLVFWTYFGYMLFLQFVSAILTKAVKKDDDFLPPISIIITAYNEESRIKAKIDNTLELDYPEDKMEIIVVSDGSTDRTDEIVQGYARRGVKLLRIPERRGKHYGQGQGVEKSANELLVMTDATTFVWRESVKKMIRNFADPSIGCISGMDFMKDARSAGSGEGLYVQYEMSLRELESACGSLVGVSGCFYAIRKEICEGWINDKSSDFYLPIFAQMKGYRTILEEQAQCYYEVLADPKKEFRRKVRTVVHGLEVLLAFKKVLNPFRFGLYSLQMFSHKLSRWLVPIYLIVLFFANLALIKSGTFYLVFFILQSAFYLIALITVLSSRIQNLPVLKVPFFFVVFNYAILVAIYEYITKKEYILWEPTKR
ncbi:MAG TPA: glycosyltransferase family 2 protein [candidate division Zixibacteria bacterium]|nr:glycosyltransferase family 2 protein [candidate division Zixibacteria bacterium]